jgi:hypothetical protein
VLASSFFLDEGDPLVFMLEIFTYNRKFSHAENNIEKTKVQPRISPVAAEMTFDHRDRDKGVSQKSFPYVISDISHTISHIPNDMDACRVRGLN